MTGFRPRRLNSLVLASLLSFGCSEDYAYTEGYESIYEWLPPIVPKLGGTYVPFLSIGPT